MRNLQAYLMYTAIGLAWSSASQLVGAIMITTVASLATSTASPNLYHLFLLVKAKVQATWQANPGPDVALVPLEIRLLVKS